MGRNRFRSVLLIFLGQAMTILAISVSGPFYIQSSVDCNVLDLKDQSRCLGVPVVAAPLKNMTSQMWDVYDLGAGYMIVNRFNGLVLDIENGGLLSGSRIITWAATYTCNQRWSFEGDGTIRSGRNNLVLDVCSPSKDKISQIIGYPRHGGKNQLFRTFLVLISMAISFHGPYYIENLANCDVLDVKPPVNIVGARVITNRQGNHSCQMWDLFDTGSGYVIANRQSGLVLDIEDGGIRPAADIIVWGSTYGCNQRFTFEPDNTIQSARNKKLVLDVFAAELGKQSKVIAYPRHGGRNQKFRLKPVGFFPPKQPQVY